jgi:hypothetical protein
MTAILEADALMAAAEAETGLSDYGDPTFRDRVRVVIGKIAEQGMDDAGQRAAAATAQELLSQRLRFFDDRKRWPLGEETIEAPLFATGEPRSGTTLLHALLSADPDSRALRFWEVMYPSPPPGLAASDDPRRAKADDDWRAMLRRMPKWLINHPYNDMLGDGIPECERTWGFDFRVLGPTVWWRVPMTPLMSGLPTDTRAQYQVHKMMLQACQFGRPKKRWVLKGFHSGRLDALFETYPDARLIWTHRDPVQSMASRIVMAIELEEGLRGGEVDLERTVPYFRELSRASIRNALASPYLDDPRVHHVRYADFVADPVGTIRGFYERFGLPFTAAAEAAMRAYLRDNKSDRYGKFVYSTDIIGADLDALHAEFAPYRERFGLEIETRR